jgi:signal transduction histidine kinase
MAIEQRLRTVFGALAFLLLAISVLQGLNRQAQIESRWWVQHTREVISELAWLRARVIDTEAAVRGYLLSGDKEYSALREEVLSGVDRHSDMLGRLIADNPSQVRSLKRLRDLLREQREAGEKLMQVLDTGGPAAAAEAFTASHARQKSDALRALLAEMDQEEQRLLDQREQQFRGSDRMWITSVALVMVVFGLLITAYVLFRRDGSHREALERDLRETNEQLQDASRLKSEFLGHMSHELRTPLNAIIGYTGTMLMRLPGPLTADQEKQLKTIQNSGRHLLSLINELLDLTKIESGKTDVKLEALPCREVIEEVVSTLRPLAQAKSLELEAKFPNQPVHATADRRAFNQILINLTNNAIKFTERGSVRLELGERNGFAAVDVIDTGIGVRQEDQPKLFMAFKQLHPGTVLREGSGLGLYLSGRLAALIGGRIEFESEYGRGSRFTVLVPKA